MCYCLPNLVCRWMVACSKVWIELHITQQHYCRRLIPSQAIILK